MLYVFMVYKLMLITDLCKSTKKGDNKKVRIEDIRHYHVKFCIK